jgi:RNA polymerase sigma factor (sigma-70 family)
MVRHTGGRVHEELPDRVVEAFGAHRRALLGLARLLTGSVERAEEVVQEAFLSLHEHIDATQPGRELPYLRKAVINQARSGWRRAGTVRRRQHQFATDPVDRVTPEAEALRTLRAAEVDAVLARLSDRQRVCVVLTYFVDLDGAATAEVLGITEGAVKRHLHRARRALALLLEEA